MSLTDCVFPLSNTRSEPMLLGKRERESKLLQPRKKVRVASYTMPQAPPPSHPLASPSSYTAPPPDPFPSLSPFPTPPPSTRSESLGHRSPQPAYAARKSIHYYHPTKQLLQRFFWVPPSPSSGFVPISKEEWERISLELEQMPPKTKKKGVKKRLAKEKKAKNAKKGRGKSAKKCATEGDAIPLIPEVKEVVDKPKKAEGKPRRVGTRKGLRSGKPASGIGSAVPEGAQERDSVDVKSEDLVPVIDLTSGNSEKIIMQVRLLRIRRPGLRPLEGRKLV